MQIYTQVRSQCRIALLNVILLQITKATVLSDPDGMYTYYFAPHSLCGCLPNTICTCAPN